MTGRSILPKAEVRALCDQAREEIRAILERPFVDRVAPRGFVRLTYRDKEMRRRLAATRRIMDRLALQIGVRCGPEAEAAVREMQRLVLEAAEAIAAGRLH